MRTYETLFVLKPNLSAEEQTKQIDFYKENIIKFGGEIINTELWGKQNLAYPIKKLTEGIYVLIQFKAENNYTDNELNKRFEYNEDIIRYVIVMIDEKKFKLKPRKEPVKREKNEYKSKKQEDGTDIPILTEPSEEQVINNNEEN